MSTMVNQLLTLARAEAGEEEVQLSPLTLWSVAEPVVEGMQPVAADSGVRLKLYGDADVSVMGDAGRLRQLLLNLLDNAIRHTPSGGSVDVSIGSLGGRALLTVADTGEGIPPGDLPHIFQRFYRGDRARQRAMGNSGLGLSIVRWIVEAHGGSIDVRSEPGHGARFSVRLPLVEAAIRQTSAVS
jgi:signal transduction histidine kinase